MIIEIQCLPTPAGDAARRYAHVDAAIARIQRSGLRYEVGALGTTVEGDPDVLWPLMREVHDACLDSGAGSAVTVVKVAESREHGDELTVDGLVAPYRDG